MEREEREKIKKNEKIFSQQDNRYWNPNNLKEPLVSDRICV